MEDCVECLICHSYYKTLGPHLGRTHQISAESYLKTFGDVELTSKTFRKNQSAGQLAAIKNDPSIIDRRGEANRRLREEDPSVNQRQSESNRRAYETDPTLATRHSDSMKLANAKDPSIGRQISQSLIQAHKDDPTISERRSESLIKANHDDPGIQQRHAETWKRRCQEDPSIGLRMSATRKEKWQDPKFAAYMVSCMVSSSHWNKHPNDSELQLQDILNKNFPGLFEFVGNTTNGRVGSRVVDFIDTQKKKKILIEMFGIYWHDPILFPSRPTEEELVEYYKQLGYTCLVFWEDVVWSNESEIVEKVQAVLDECK